MGEFQERQVVGIHSDSTICEFTFHAFPMLCGNRQRVPSQIEKEREKELAYLSRVSKKSKRKWMKRPRFIRLLS